MTIQEFNRRLKGINPNLHVRQRGQGYGDIAGLFDGREYLIRMTKGELNVNGYRIREFGDDLRWHEGNIMKRGRKTVVKMLEKKGYLNLNQRASLLWGI